MYYAVQCTTWHPTATTKHTVHRGAPRGSAAQFHRGARGRRHLGRQNTGLDLARLDECTRLPMNGVTGQLKPRNAETSKHFERKLCVEDALSRFQFRLKYWDALIAYSILNLSALDRFAYWQMMTRGYDSLELECSEGTVFAFATGSSLHTHKVSHVTLTRFMTKRANMSARVKICCWRGYYH